jgi:tetratricopeptide (TPR) repeat protein
MSRTEKLDLAIHLFILGIFFLSAIGSCSTFSYYVNPQNPNELKAYRYEISKEDYAQFASTLRPYRGDPDTLYKQACYLQEKRKYKLALKVLEDVILADATHVRAYNAMGVIYDILRDFPRAVEAYKRALKLNPNLAYVQNNLGYSYLLQGNLDSAIESFKAAIVMDDKNERYHNNLGLAYAKKGLYDDALNEFMAGRDEAKAHYIMAQVLNQLYEYDRAQIHFFISSKLNPQFQQAKTESTVAEDSSESVREYESVQGNDLERKSINRIEVDENGNKKLWFKINAENVQTTEDEKFKTDISKLNDLMQVADLQIETEPRLPPAELEVEISNGNGVNRMAARVGNYLSKKGVKITRLTNADHFNYEETMIYYQWDHLQDAFKIAQEIPGYQNMERLNSHDRKSEKIKVRIGKDLVPYDELFKGSS